MEAALVIDIGNTFTKIAVFAQAKVLHTEQHKQPDEGIINNILSGYPVKKAIISSVKKEIEEWQNVLAKKIKLIYFNTGMTSGITNHYLTPQTLGLDRLAAVIGAYHLYPGKSNMVIDGGTCITYDWVDAAGNYFGGSISPGLNMRYKALNNYTAGLPLVEADETFAAISGNDTKSAILSGVQNGIKYELEGFIKSYKKKGEELNIVLTGGDSYFFDTLLKNSIFAACIKIEPQLVLKGLNAAIQTNND
ncbi:type III pantothenate kinase [Mucilaginibacter sp. L3T2-6]|uniref:type III pantothenate kinase n=1 Tax=Mucilaginibacter sp. L3T2-6 TaxID=3062491 RepID=UPI002675DA18|nr:type III pantothenate kinase [Mucilaginibacter sp. L3T2-6]MDO3640689.1 type III pantothenate kinase [Mucilaginibacter sp. L3T2-6]MDV6212971.1 type III pantothenate kinase [Mucilaginibacter sp. L3T2-6]